MKALGESVKTNHVADTVGSIVGRGVHWWLKRIIISVNVLEVKLIYLKFIAARALTRHSSRRNLSQFVSCKFSVPLLS